MSFIIRACVSLFMCTSMKCPNMIEKKRSNKLLVAALKNDPSVSMTKDERVKREYKEKREILFSLPRFSTFKAKPNTSMCDLKMGVDN